MIVLSDASLIFGMKILCSIGLLWFGLMVAAVSYTLINGSVKPNHWYGVRFPQSFYSEESWYKINAYGGKVLMVWGLFVALTGVLFFFLPLDSTGALFAVLMGTYASIIVPIIVICAYARHFKRQPEKSVKGGI